MGVAIALAGGGSAAACVCVPRSDANLRAQADAVFVGTATARVDGNPGPGTSMSGRTEYTFAVERGAKGAVAGSQVTISTSSFTSCGCTFPIGQRWVVYASRQDGLHWANACGGSRPLGAEEAPFALRRVAVFGIVRDRVQLTIAEVHPGRHSGREAARIVVARQPTPNNALGTAIPRGTRLLGYNAGGGTVRLRLSRRFAELTGPRLRLALAQLVYTMNDLPGVRRVRVRTELGPIPGFDRPLIVADFRHQASGGPTTSR